MKKVQSFIQRKSLLYRTDVEYGDYTINHVEGCSHGCRYPCYAMMMAKRFGKVKTYEEWTRPKLVDNAAELLTRELKKYRGSINKVHFCFTTDPFMYGYSEISDATIGLMQILNEHDISCTSLTKGVLPGELANLRKNNEYGITLVSLNEKFRTSYEPGSAPYEERIKSLYHLHKKGFKTWVSIEPYPTPNIVEQSIAEILDKVAFADTLIFGKLNYNPKVREYRDYKNFFSEMTDTVLEFCEKNNKGFHIKRETSKVLSCEVKEKQLSSLVVNY
ncbi:MAG: radical SAM protein [Spirochaetota bacterium]